MTTNDGFAGVWSADDGRIDDTIAALEDGLVERGIDANTRSADRFRATGNSPHTQDAVTILFDGYLLDGNAAEQPEQQVADLYQQHGVAAVARLDGSFRIAIHDASQNALHLVTDAHGTKCLYYAITEKHVLFASHLTPLLAPPGIDNSIDEKAVRDYLFSATSPPYRGNSTLVDGVKQLPPSTILTWKNSTPHEQQYRDFTGNERGAAGASVVERTEDLLRSAVAQHLTQMTGTPTISLSGGRDSAVLTAIVAEVSDEPVQTFTYGATDQMIEPGRKRAAELGVAHESVRFPASLLGSTEMWDVEQPWPGMFLHRHQLLPDHGIQDYFNGRGAEPAFPDRQQYLELMGRLKRFHPFFHLLKRYSGDRLISTVPDVGGIRPRACINTLASPYHSGLATRQLQDPKTQQLLPDHVQYDLTELERTIDNRWQLGDKRFASESERFLYTQLRESGIGLSHSGFPARQHLPFLHPPLLKYRWQRPRKQRQKQRTLSAISDRVLPSNCTFTNAMHQYREERRQYLLRNRDQYRAAMNQFLDRGILDAGEARPYLLQADVGDASREKMMFMTKAYLLEVWIETIIERARPSISP